MAISHRKTDTLERLFDSFVVDPAEKEKTEKKKKTPTKNEKKEAEEQTN